MQILNGAIVKYVGQWSTTYTIGANDLVNRVKAELVKDGLTVRSASQDAGILGGTVFGFTIEPRPFNAVLELQIANGLGFGSENDIIGLVEHEVQQITGSLPSASSIPTVQQPLTASGAGASQNTVISTGQPNSTLASSASSSSFIDTLKQLVNNTTFVTVGLGLGLVAAILLIASPQGQVLRRATR